MNEQWAKAPETLISADLTGAQRLVFLFLDLTAGRKGHCSLTQQEIAEGVGLRRRQTVNEAVARLAELDLISFDKDGKSRRYFIHQRGEAAASRMAQLPLDSAADVSAQPDTLSTDVSALPDMSAYSPGPDVSVLADTLTPDVSAQPDMSGNRTFFKDQRGGGLTDRSRSSSSLDPDRARSKTARCAEHDIEGLASQFADGQFYHPKTDGTRCTFVPALAPKPDPYAGVYLRS